MGKNGAGRAVRRLLQESWQEMVAAENERSGPTGDLFGGSTEPADGLDGSGVSVYCNVTAPLQPRAPNRESMCRRRSMNASQGVHKCLGKAHTVACLSMVLAGVGGAGRWFSSGSHR